MSNLAVVETQSLTDLVTADKADNAKIMALLGQASEAGSTKSVDFLPKLAIEHNTEDEEGNTLPRGQWKFKGCFWAVATLQRSNLPAIPAAVHVHCLGQCGAILRQYVDPRGILW